MGTHIPWWKAQAQFRDKKAVIKLFNEDGSFLTSVNTPSIYWPLNGAYEVFTYENTSYIADDPTAVSLFDSQEYQIGHCYQNTQRITDIFRNAGYDIKTYCGWAFINDTVPVHHCWAVVSYPGNQKAVLDLSCDSFRMRQWIAERKEEDPAWNQLGRGKEILAEWVTYSLKALSNSQRCYPLGVVPPTHLYIGSECKPEDGIALYQKLMAQYPGHLCDRSVNGAGYNPTQWFLKQKGLMA